MNYIDLIKKHEGLKLKPYRCSSGKLTIGYGRNLDDNGISFKEAEMMLITDIENCKKQLSEKILWWKDQPENVQEVLINMTFNLGIFGLLQFKKTLEHIRLNRHEQASNEMLCSKWAKQVGIRAIELSEIIRKTEKNNFTTRLEKLGFKLFGYSCYIHLNKQLSIRNVKRLKQTYYIIIDNNIEVEKCYTTSDVEIKILSYL